MDNEIQKLKTNEEKLKSRAIVSQSHDYKNAELCQSEDIKHPELEGDVGILQKTHNDHFLILYILKGIKIIELRRIIWEKTFEYEELELETQNWYEIDLYELYIDLEQIDINDQYLINKRINESNDPPPP